MNGLTLSQNGSNARSTAVAQAFEPRFDLFIVRFKRQDDLIVGNSALFVSFRFISEASHHMSDGVRRSEADRFRKVENGLGRLVDKSPIVVASWRQITTALLDTRIDICRRTIDRPFQAPDCVLDST